MKLQALILIASLASAGSAYAQGGPSPEMQAARAAMMKACSTDAASLCSGKMGREMGQCLRDNADKVSPDCKDAMSKMPARPAAPPPPQG
jgi:hypothetical protein